MDSKSTLRNVGFVIAGVGAAAAITGVVLVLTAGDSEKYETPPNGDGAQVRWLAAPGSVWLLGRF